MIHVTDCDFGYPARCTKCKGLNSAWIGLQVTKAYYQDKKTRTSRMMLVGQDPTINKHPERVKYPLMLDDESGQLRKWLIELLGPENFESMTLYGTNVVKCTFDKPPSRQGDGGLKFLKPYFGECKVHLEEELQRFKPTHVMSLGEPAHRLFRSILDNPNEIPERMKMAFKGSFRRVSCRGYEFLYTPCLHISQYRVAITYGDRARLFKELLPQTLSAYDRAIK